MIECDRFDPQSLDAPAESAKQALTGYTLTRLDELTHPDAFRPWPEAGCDDVVMPDVKYAGGISGVLRVAELAAQYATACAPHNPMGPVLPAVFAAFLPAANTPLPGRRIVWAARQYSGATGACLWHHTQARRSKRWALARDSGKRLLDFSIFPGVRVVRVVREEAQPC